ncbi:Zinc finger, PMZ-type [Sesbania bispinosa]|nr:Zinc finger, PMZ-type [Sesbania bispinosa]
MNVFPFPVAARYKLLVSLVQKTELALLTSWSQGYAGAKFRKGFAGYTGAYYQWWSLLPCAHRCGLAVMEQGMYSAVSEEPTWQGLEQMSVSREDAGESDYGGVSNEWYEEEEDFHSDEDSDDATQEGVKVVNSGDEIKIGINCEEDIKSLDLVEFSPHMIRHYDFPSCDIAYLFYSLYGKSNGFSVRKGLRQDRGLKMEDRKREIRPETRCNCRANFRVHIDIVTGRWYATVFLDEHTHDLLDSKYCGMLPGHRKMSESDITEMNSLLEAGIGPTHIYGHFALQHGGYDKIGFRLKDIYNQIERQRRKQTSDAMAAMEYLRGLSCDDNMMFIEHTVDDEGRLQHLFWTDGISKKSYQVFGDVVAFDATYGKNKYLLPLEPTAIITDGDVTMRNAIKIVFPNARHRLCAWHLQRNATANVKNPQFTAEFERLMLGEYDIGQFGRRWDATVTKYGLQEHPWVKKMFDSRSKWATAYFRGNFFAGFRTTSRCESLHAELGKYVHSRHNLTDFLHHYHRCLSHMRYKELADEFSCLHGEAVMQTKFPSIERSTAKHFTRRVFGLFRAILEKANDITVCSCSELLMYYTFTVTKGSTMKEWRVSFYPSSFHFKCSCMWMESRGLPCEHIVAVLVHLNIEEIPMTLVLRRWTLGALGDGHRLSHYFPHNVSGYSLINSNEEIIRDPTRASTKGRGSPSSSNPSGTVRRRTHCSYCKLSGHNRVTCPKRAQDTQQSQDNHEGSVSPSFEGVV